MNSSWGKLCFLSFFFLIKKRGEMDYKGKSFLLLIQIEERMWEPMRMLPNTRWVAAHLANTLTHNPKSFICKNSVTWITIVDYCPPGCYGTINLSEDAFSEIVVLSAGIIEVNYIIYVSYAQIIKVNILVHNVHKQRYSLTS